MKAKTCVILGYGDRSSRYAKYAELHPDEMRVIGVIDPDSLKQRLAKEAFSLKDEDVFSDIGDFLAANVKCDFIINGTMDSLHYKTSVPLLKRGYNLLLEKPVTANYSELLDLYGLSKENHCKTVVCHVLRYTPFYSTIKKIIDSGKIGKITDMQLNEHVWYGHFVNSYVRGKWRSEKECGSGLLLAKSCHDTDLICWLNNAVSPVSVSSFGSKSFFCEKNAPKNSARRCCDCAVKDNCMFNAYTFELEKDFIPFYTWSGIGKPIEEITKEEKIKYLENSVYGECVYKTDMDIVDRQCVSVEFDNGSIATLNVVGGTSKAGRHIHVICEYGEIVGYVEENKLTVRVFNKEKICYEEETIFLQDDTPKTSEDNSVAGHYGGDYLIMRDFLRYLRGEKTSSSTTMLEDSVNGHLLCYAAERARKERRVVELSEFFPQKTV